MTEVRLLADTVWTALDGIAGVNAFDGEVTAPPLDDDGRVHAYAVFYPSPGSPVVRRMCASGSLAWGFQVTAVGGDRERLLWCVDKVRAALSALPVREISDEAGLSQRIRRDDDVTPPRFYVPIEYGQYVNG